MISFCHRIDRLFDVVFPIPNQTFGLCFRFCIRQQSAHDAGAESLAFFVEVLNERFVVFELSPTRLRAHNRTHVGHDALKFHFLGVAHRKHIVLQSAVGDFFTYFRRLQAVFEFFLGSGRFECAVNRCIVLVIISPSLRTQIIIIEIILGRRIVKRIGLVGQHLFFVLAEFKRFVFSESSHDTISQVQPDLFIGDGAFRCLYPLRVLFFGSSVSPFFPFDVGWSRFVLLV